MECARCKKTVEEKLEQQQLCQDCFVELIEQRTRKTLAKKGLKKGDKILIIDDGSKEFIVGEYLFRKIIEKVPLTIEIKKKEETDIEKARQEYTAIILPRDMDDEAETLLLAMINNIPLQKDNTINVLEKVYDEEVKIFADIKKFNYKEQEKSHIKKSLETIKQKYPQAEFALMQHIKAIKGQ